MNIVFVSPEMQPLAKVGGVADVTAGLAVALHRLKERVSVIAPLYGSIDRSRHRLRPTGVTVRVWMDGSLREAPLWLHSYRGVPVYLLEHEIYYGRQGIYGEGGVDYPDNAFRYAFLARAGLEAARALELAPDVFHIHDWQTGLLPVYQKLFYRTDPAVGRAGVVLSLHNLAYQGVFPRNFLPRLGLPREIFHIEGLEFWERVNFLKGGMIFSEMLTTVSPTYAREIHGAECGRGLEGVVRKRSEHLVGILNGLDPVEWDPSKDKALATPYSANRLEGKAENKQTLQREIGLDASSSPPLFGMIGRLDHQKGFDLLAEAAPSLVSDGAQIVTLGSGDRDLLARLQALTARYPGRVSVHRGFQEELGRRIYAGADLFLMPSRHEPCGLSQMIALRYGTIPVVRKTGGLADTIVDVDEDPAAGTGFVFEALEPEALLAAARRAMACFGDREAWNTLIGRGMRLDFSWKRASRDYRLVYARAEEMARGSKRG